VGNIRKSWLLNSTHLQTDYTNMIFVFFSARRREKYDTTFVENQFAYVDPEAAPYTYTSYAMESHKSGNGALINKDVVKRVTMGRAKASP
jgi:hypothetical protein